MASGTEILLVVAVTLAVIALTKVVFFSKKLKRPPGPRPFPLIGSLHLLGTHPHQSITNLAKQYGPLMSIQLGQKDFIVGSSPDAAREFLKLQDANFSARATPRAAELIIPNDLVLNDITPVFRHLRKIFVGELASPKRLQATKNVRAEEIAYMLQSIAKLAGQPVVVNTYLHIMSSNMLSRMILGKRFLGGSDSSSADEGEMREFIYIVLEMTKCFGCIHPQDFFDIVPKWCDFGGLDARFLRLRKRMDVFYTNMVEQHKESRRKNPISDEDRTLLDVLLAQLENQEFVITESHVNSLIWDTFSAGSDTTMLTSEWAIAEAIRNPAILHAAQSELDRVIGQGRAVLESDIPELKYIQALVKEALRLHAPLPMLVPHLSVNDTKAFGYDIPAKTRLFVNIWGICRDPSVWENPLEFTPERFMGSGGSGVSGRDFQGQCFEFTPFGSGRRSCPGMGIAAIAMHLQVASLLHAFDWELPGGARAETLDLSEGTGFTVPMKNPLVAVPKHRLPPHVYQLSLAA